MRFFALANSILPLIDLILANPIMDSRRVHAELHGGGRDRFASSHERDCAQTKLGGEWSWHG